MLAEGKRSRREFIANTAVAAAGTVVGLTSLSGAEKPRSDSQALALLPSGPTPLPIPLPHFPDRLHAFVWRNWTLVPIEKLASVLGTGSPNVTKIATSMGLLKRPRITADQQRRSYISVIKRNWHLLPYEQLLELLDWSAERLAYVLREDDFLYVKLGGLKPKCAPLKYGEPDAATAARASEMGAIIRQELGELRQAGEPLFAFVKQLSEPLNGIKVEKAPRGPRFCYSYFALYGDPLLEQEAAPYPAGYLSRLAAAGVNGVWLQAVLYKLAPFPWQPELSDSYQARLKNLKRLVARAREHGIGIYLYLNEPRSMPLAFFKQHPELKGVAEGEHAALCTSRSEVRSYITNSIRSICEAVPGIAGFFTITASENLTNCWSHGAGARCPRCGRRPASEVIAELNRAVFEGIKQSDSPARLLAWDWGWSETWAEDAIKRLPKESMLLSVSEWDLPIKRGGVSTSVGEYSISSIGPGPRATRHWALAKAAGMKCVAKVQAGNTWELSAVPYIPAVRNVAEHAANLRKAGLDGVMLGWTLGGYPSPNLEVFDAVDHVAREAGHNGEAENIVDEALRRVAGRRFGKEAAGPMVTAWTDFSRAFSEFPYHGGVVYSAPLQVGPANLLWSAPTGYAASMVGFPYDDLDRWRSVYPAGIFASQLEKVANGFDAGLSRLMEFARGPDWKRMSRAAQREWHSELRVAEAAAIHFRSTANQARFVIARKSLSATKDVANRSNEITRIEEILRRELHLAKRLYELQQQDSRIGFEASNHYYYVPIDLAEKILNCRDLLDRWIPDQRRTFKDSLR